MRVRLPLKSVEHRASSAAADVRDRAPREAHRVKDAVGCDPVLLAEPLRLKIAHSFGVVLA